jgi:hypothetical protein
MRTVILISFLLFSGLIKGQIGEIPLHYNPNLYFGTLPSLNQASQELSKYEFKDTLDLPFWDDFSLINGKTDSLRWQNSYVFVNAGFPVLPPTIGVATFDFLDEEGLPYAALDEDEVMAADTLTSQCINLEEGIDGPYDLSDSIFLSFFYQSPGLGDFITNLDSFKLEFRNDTGKWVQIWGVSGERMDEFEQVMIQIEEDYLYEGFQFRFVNISRKWGNNNQWHLDYIYLNEKRGFDVGAANHNLRYNDRALQTRPTCLLKDYSMMPYAHFMINPSDELADTVYFRISNLSVDPQNVQVKYEEKINGTVIGSSEYSENNQNAGAFASSARKIDIYNAAQLSGFTERFFNVERTYSTRIANGVEDALFRSNNDFTFEHPFNRFFAYDDGSAESGFGFNDLRNGEGKIVVAFETRMLDTLRAVDFYFTPNIEDNTFRQIEIQIWRDIAVNGGTDDLIYDTLVTDLAGWKRIQLPQGVELPAGKFYVGWSQNREFNLGVGYDKNNGYLPGERSRNENIFFNIDNQGWVVNNNDELDGAPMIRAIVGAEDPWTASVEPISEHTLQVFPNPVDGENVFLTAQVRGAYSWFNLNGQLVGQGQIRTSQIPMPQVGAGVYLLTIETELGLKQFRIIKR